MDSWFYRLSWHGQMIAGTLLFAISFVLEQQVLTRYLGDVALATALAAALEASKVLTIVLHRFLSEQSETGYPSVVRTLALIFRVALLALSALCSVMYLGHRLDRPELRTVRASDMARVTREAASARARLAKDEAADTRQSRGSIRESYAALRRQLDERYLPAIRSLQQALDREMNRVVHGVFEGPRYRAIEVRLAREKRGFDRQVITLSTREQQALVDSIRRIHDGYRRRIANLDRRTRARLAAIRLSDYSGDPRVEDPMLVSFLRTIAAVFGLHLRAVQFVFGFSLFLSALLELGILVSFENLTGAHLPVLAAEHRISLRTKRRRIETEGELAEEQLGDRRRRARTRAWVDDMVADLGRAGVPEDDKLAETPGGARAR